MRHTFQTAYDEIKHSKGVLRRIRLFMRISENVGITQDTAYRHARRCKWQVENEIQELERVK